MSLAVELASAVVSERTLVVLGICSLIYVHFKVHFRYFPFLNASLLHLSLTSGIEGVSSSDSTSRWARISPLRLKESGIIAVFTAKPA